jgi:hypothetical protein
MSDAPAKPIPNQAARAPRHGEPSVLDAFRDRCARAAALSLLALAMAASASRAQTPSLIDELVKTSSFTETEIRGIGDAPLVRELQVADPGTRAAFAGIVRIQSDGAALAEALAAPERAPLAKGTHRRGRFHDPPRPADVAEIEFSADELEVLADCKVTACKFKLGREGIEAFGANDWSHPDAGDRFHERIRSEALAYVDGYRKQGNAALVVYADKSTPVALGTTLESILREFAAFQRQAPGFSSYLLRYPSDRRPETSDSIVWQVVDFGYRPTLVIDHIVVDRRPEVPGATALVASKTIYANHYLAGRIQMGAVLDGQAALGVAGHFLLLVDRIAFDEPLSGFKRKLLGNGLHSSLGERLEYLRALADGSR